MRLDQIKEYIELSTEFEEMSPERRQRLAAAIQGADKGGAIRWLKYQHLGAAFAAMQAASHTGLDDAGRREKAQEMKLALRLAEHPDNWAKQVLKDK